MYIATTKGLVQVQSITALSDPDLHSVISINKTSTLAKISPDYKNFVQKPQGLIHAIFGCHAYRLNIASQIDQGSSWQLGVYIAHALAQDCNNMSYTASEDTIFIASGKIDTLNYKVLNVEALPQKCISANAQISKWQADGHAVHFFVPHDNLRQPLPDTSINLTPVQSLTQINDFLLHNGFIKYPIEFTSGVSENKHVTNHDKPPFSQNEGLSANVNIEKVDSEDIEQIESVLTQTRTVSQNQALLTNAKDNISFIPQLFKTAKTKMLLLFCIVLLAVFFFWFGHSTIHYKIDKFELVSYISENRQLCSLASEKPVVYTGNLSQASSISALNLQHLCALSLRTYTDFNQVWLVSETGAILPLLRHASLSGNSKDINGVTWGIPLPSENISRQYYHLLLFPNKVDLADKQSLQDYLMIIQSQHSKHSTQDIVAWSHAQNTPVFIIQNELYQP